MNWYSYLKSNEFHLIGVPQGAALRALLIVMTRCLRQPGLMPVDARGIAHVGSDECALRGWAETIPLS